MKRTLVLGKFYPPHKGHHYLIQQALQHSEHVIILCLGSIKDTYTPRQRIAALKVLLFTVMMKLHTMRTITKYGTLI